MLGKPTIDNFIECIISNELDGNDEKLNSFRGHRGSNRRGRVREQGKIVCYRCGGPRGNRPYRGRGNFRGRGKRDKLNAHTEDGDQEEVYTMDHEKNHDKEEEEISNDGNKDNFNFYMENLILKNKLLKMRIYAKGTPIEALVDCGASIDIVDSKTVHKIQHDQITNSVGETTVTFEVGHKSFTTKMLIVENLPFEVILSHKFLNEAKAIINFGERKVEFLNAEDPKRSRYL
eukprot:TRINITY_DN2714_c0_g1_i2.p1 TRINITY_DN2714_c0_g1~~TRINITY_DN2714_c0_g1_i2.p1  ORF type:complete len:268 (-),score=44.31 TRINITY_DN2714_c0_g1_i2:1955-2650(-)